MFTTLYSMPGIIHPSPRFTHFPCSSIPGYNCFTKTQTPRPVHPPNECINQRWGWNLFQPHDVMYVRMDPSALSLAPPLSRVLIGFAGPYGQLTYMLLLGRLLRRVPYLLERALAPPKLTTTFTTATATTTASPIAMPSVSPYSNSHSHSQQQQQQQQSAWQGATAATTTTTGAEERAGSGYWLYAACMMGWQLLYFLWYSHFFFDDCYSDFAYFVRRGSDQCPEPMR